MHSKMVDINTIFFFWDDLYTVRQDNIYIYINIISFRRHNEIINGNKKTALTHRSRVYLTPWWRHQMETFSALLAICAGNSPVPGEFPAQRPVTRSFDVFFDLRLNKRLGIQSWGWWFETLSRPSWRHCNVRSGDCWWRRKCIRRRHNCNVSTWKSKRWVV